MENEFEYELKGKELKVLKKIAKEENKTIQELFDEIMIEFVNKNTNHIKTTGETDDSIQTK